MRNKNRFRYHFQALTCAVVWTTLIVLCHNACTAPKTELPGPLAYAEPADIDAAMTPPPMTGRPVRTLPLYSPEGLEVPAGPDGEVTRGNVHEIFGRTVCRTNSPLPYIFPQLMPPKVGQSWSCTFTTAPSSPFPDVDCWLLVSHNRGDSIDFTPHNMPGCWLHVRLEQVIHVPVGYDRPGLLSRQGGQITFSYVPPPEMAGRLFWMQLLVSTPTGLISSHAIEVLVGS